MIEFKEAAYDRITELLDESIEYTGKTKMALCELYDVLDEAFEDSMEDEEEPSINLRKSRSGMRYKRGMHMRRNRLGRYAY